MKKHTSYYPIDPNKFVELSRLLRHDQLLTDIISGLLPHHLDPASLHMVLDLGCGPGGWLIELARHYPHLQLTGLDISEQMITYAQKQAEIEQFSQIRFLQGSFETLTLQEQFDLVNARSVLWFVDSHDRSRLVKTWYQAVQPGGWLRLIDAEMPQTNGPACECITDIFLHMLHDTGKTITPPSSHNLMVLAQEDRSDRPFIMAPRAHGITLILRDLLEEAGCENIHLESRILDYSAGSPAHEAFLQDILLGLLSYRDVLIASVPGLTPQIFEQLLSRSKQEMQAPDFLGQEVYLCVWGQKPR
jgi:ubiquinone/menaquinone biosynthesis C-methylase UbiE